MGFFSWETQDTQESISNAYSIRGPRPVKMINPLTGEVFKESEYEGYGNFGGKDYYELLAELNGYGPSRDMGISLEFREIKTDKPIIWPVLVTIDYHGDIKGFGKPANCEVQGYFYDE